ncbi:hypothetical protein AURDEDRAFT_174184 [Auricularia subglabra TFB-10046 SS5]|nr:hypothetical protein AURDEDRAFT_174184 [Auricularia subglabra TFB-10046 SS5]
MAAGTDLSGVGLFNLNNSTVLSHALLNKYDSHLSAGEMPFNAFCTAVVREYELYASALPFLHPDRFRMAWFATGYPKHRKTSSLRPPTHVCKASPVCRDVKPAKTPLQLVGDAALHRKAIAVIRWALPHGRTSIEEQDMNVDHNVEDTTEDAPAGRNEGNKAQKAAPPHSIKDDFVALPEKGAPIDPSRQLWLELLLQLVAHESVIQFALYRSWHEIMALRKEDLTPAQHDACIRRLHATVPALGHVLSTTLPSKDEGEDGGVGARQQAYRLDPAIWATRLGQVRRHIPEEPNSAVFQDQDDWKKTGCFYSMPQVRARPQYPGLRTDSKVDRNVVKGADGIGCSKYYAEYGQKGYTGGVVAFWCTHGICYGFHCVPEGEGRNDAFS